MIAVSPEDRAVVERFKRSLIEQGMPVHQVILFGSRARGDYEPDSDYDLLVIVESADRAITETIRHCAWEIEFDKGILMPTIVVTRDDVENTPFRSSLLMQAVREEGVPI